MSQTLPSLSVVIPNYNHGHLIGNQLRSIFAQSVQPTRIIVIDDASTDDSISVIRQLTSTHPNAELICKDRNSGVIAVINEAMHIADTEYITFPAADDVILPGFFETSLTLLSQHPEAALCSAISHVRHDFGDSAIPNWTAYPCSTAALLTPKLVRDRLFQIEDWFMGNTVIYRRDLLIAAGGFDPELLSFADGFICRVLALRHGACFVPEPLAINYQSDGSYSSATSRDERKVEQILTISNARMTTDFRDLFSAELVARTNARMLFRVLSAKLDNLVTRTQASIQSAQPMRRGSLLLFAVRWTTRVLKVLLFCILRFRDIPRVALSKLWPGPLPG